MLIRRRCVASLCVFCLLAVTQRLAAQNCLQEIQKTVDHFMTKAPMKLSDCRLYTPSLSDFQQKCPRTTMKCFAVEVKVLMEELKLIEGRQPPRLNMMLDRLAVNLHQTNSECPQCELLQEEKATDFLEALNKTLRMMSNSPVGC